MRASVRIKSFNELGNEETLKKLDWTSDMFSLVGERILDVTINSLKEFSVEWDDYDIIFEEGDYDILKIIEN